jgi:hypothetical protein
MEFTVRSEALERLALPNRAVVPEVAFNLS